MVLLGRTPPAAPATARAKRTGHRRVGDDDGPGDRYVHLITSLCFFLVAGAMAMLIRGELLRPGLQRMSAQENNVWFTEHGMLLLHATP
jgi:cytochrome c oxidase subunit I